MKIIFWPVLIFLAAFLLHFFIWKIRLPNKQLKALLKIFFLTYLSVNVVYYIFAFFLESIRQIFPFDLLENLHAFLLFTSLTLTYITTYSAVEVDSPSLLITMLIQRNFNKGLDKHVLSCDLTDELLVIPRLKDLVRDGLVEIRNNKYKITKKGIFLERIFIFYRNLLKAGKGG